MKVLIYYNENELKPIGGPSGYLYNLKKEIDDRKIEYIDFLKSNDKKGCKTKIYNKLRKIYIDKFPKKLKLILPFYENKTFKKIFGKRKKEALIDLNLYDVVHFHSALSMYMVKDSLKDYRGKVIFTTHCPKVSYKEILDNMITHNKYEKNKEKYDRLDIIDEYAFDRADYIHFPTLESEECYYNTWEKYSEIHERNKEKYIYIPTGINPVNIYSNSKLIREKYNIPQDAFVISYVGRHNKVKGYANLKEIGKKILSNDSNTYFLIAGKEEPIKGLKNDRWIEIGWTNKPHDIINASDLFILPNQETYFDLILLEVLSIGKTVLITNTGGNKYFKNFKDSGIFYYEYGNIDNAVNMIDKIKKLNLDKLEKSNKELMLENFTTKIFVDNYLKKLNEICK